MKISLWQSTKTVARQSQNWKCGIYTGLLNTPIFVLAALWGNLYVSQAYGFSLQQSASITSMIFIGEIVGAPIVGWISDKLNSRKPPMIIGALLSLVVMMAIIYIPRHTGFDLSILFLLLGFAISSQVISYPTTAESNNPSIISSAMGFVSLLSNLLGAVLQIIFGWILNLGWNGALLNNVALYSLENYKNALIVLLIGFVISFVCAAHIKETYCKSISSK